MRVVDRQADGVVVSGAKLHITGAKVSHVRDELSKSYDGHLYSDMTHLCTTSPGAQ